MPTGIISSSHNLGIEDYEKVEAPIVAFDRNLAPKIPIVSSDNFEGGKLAARALVKAGCQRIVMITGDNNSDSPTGLRQLGFNYELTKKVLFVLFQRFVSHATRIRNQIYHFS